MFQDIPTKERLRGRAVEALNFYQAMTLHPLIEALRPLHCPQRRGFSVRYLARDAPLNGNRSRRRIAPTYSWHAGRLCACPPARQPDSGQRW